MAHLLDAGGYAVPPVGPKRAFDPTPGAELPAIDVPAHAGTAFDGEFLYQIAEGNPEGRSKDAARRVDDPDA